MTYSLALEDRADLRDLVHRYAAMVDDRDVPGVAGLFAADGVLASAAPPQHLDPVHEQVGPEGVATAMRRLLGLHSTFHAICGEVFSPGHEPGLATGRIACQAHHVTDSPSGPKDLVWTVTYRDAYRRTGGGWRFARREVHVGSVMTQPIRTIR